MVPSRVLVVFEGIDGAGKTTQARLLAERLRQEGCEVVETKEPTNGPHGRRLRASASTGRLPRDEELQAFLDDRRDHVATLVGPCLAAGKVVIIDRYYFSTAAYQGARGFDPDEIIATNEAFAPVPDLLVILDLPVEEGLRRIDRREAEAGPNHFEKQATLEACRAIFNRVDRPFVLRLDATRPIDALHEQIVAAVHARR